jgi:hypothetical protein
MVLFTGCGEDGAKGLDGNGDGNGDSGGEGDAAASGLFGSWIGDYTDIDSESALKLEGAQAKAEFKKNDDGNTFSISIPNSELLVEGTFSHPNTSNLLLNIKKSNFSSIGLPGATPRVEFQLTGTDLELFNSRFSILLARDGDADPDPEDEESDGSPGSYAGNWVCSDKFNNSWKLRVKTGSFSADITNPKTGVLRLTGSAKQTGTDIASASLVVTGSNNSSQIGTTLAVKNVSYLLIVLLTDPNGNQSKFQCDRD